MTISDGFAQYKTFFASDACKMITSGIAKSFSVCEILNAVVNTTDKTMVIVVKINVIYDNLNEIIGNPMDFDEYQKKVSFIN